MRSGRAVLIVAALTALAAPGCATMTKQEQEVMQGQIARIDDRVAVMSKSARMQAELTADFATLRRSVLTMTGQIEEFNTRSQILAERLDRMEKAMAEMSQVYRSEVLERSASTDLRLDTLSRQLYELSLQSLAFIDLMEKKNDISPKTHQRKIDAMRGDAPPEETAPPAQEPDALYQYSYQKFLAADYEGAATGFSRFVERYADHTLADSAGWWIGEARYILKQYGPAADAFDALVKAHPQSPKAPAALLRSATALLSLGRTEGAVTRLRTVVAAYPETGEARSARQTLTSLGVPPAAPAPTPEPMLTPVPDIPLVPAAGDEGENPHPPRVDAPTSDR